MSPLHKYLCISSLVLSPNIFAEYKSFYVRKLMVEYLSPSTGEVLSCHTGILVCYAPGSEEALYNASLGH